ncbi:MAG: hypothetical protein ACI9GW_001307 [Halieaceae bacterium]|jgi:hypothetical protein
MNNLAEVDVMNSLLFSSGATDLPEVKELNSLLYRNSEDFAQNAPIVQLLPSILGHEKIKVHVSKNKARISIKVTRKISSRISIDRIAEAAVNAIKHELEKVKS